MTSHQSDSANLRASTKRMVDANARLREQNVRSDALIARLEADNRIAEARRARRQGR